MNDVNTISIGKYTPEHIEKLKEGLGDYVLELETEAKHTNEKSRFQLYVPFVFLGWRSNFRTTKYRTTDISKFQNCEY